jgi:hypothetical protein
VAQGTVLAHVNDGVEGVYIGRPSRWGNPFVIGKDGTRAEVIEKYRQHVLSSPELLAGLESLRGKTLLCFCKPLPCHGDVLIELVETPTLESLIGG